MPGNTITSESVQIFCVRFLAQELPPAYRSERRSVVAWKPGTIHNVCCLYGVLPLQILNAVGDMGWASSGCDRF